MNSDVVQTNLSDAPFGGRQAMQQEASRPPGNSQAVSQLINWPPQSSGAVQKEENEAGLASLIREFAAWNS